MSARTADRAGPSATPGTPEASEHMAGEVATEHVRAGA